MTDGLLDLLEAVFPGIGEGMEELRRFGVPWESVSRPFVALEGGRPVSHAGLIELPLVLMGKPGPVGTVHAVATHPEFRGRGFYRRAMEDLLAYAGTRYETLVLTTEHPEYFERFGFREVAEHRFILDSGESRGEGARRTARGALRKLDLGDPADIRLMQRLLEAREPVSRVVGVAAEKAIFCFNEGRRFPRYDPDLDVMLCLEEAPGRLRLLDVVGPVLPGLEEILARIPGPPDAVEFGFSPDRFTSRARAEPVLFDHDGPSHLMVRGPFAAEGTPFSLPRSART